eukprot:XP_027320657.1 amyloid-beta A4 precursor protein-binding family B member 1-like [Anas platyrhynchos]
MSEEELAPGRSSVAVNNCIRQLSLHQHGAPGAWGGAAPGLTRPPQGRAMLLLLQSQTLKLVDPQDQTLLHAQPVASIRVWGVGRDSGRERDFAYVARDQLTQMLKCHVFRCESPAKDIATSLHEVCSQVSPGLPWVLPPPLCPPAACAGQRDFAYVARDQLTQMLKCHVFRCESPAKDIATSLHEVCSQVSPGLPWVLPPPLCPPAACAGQRLGAAS